MIASKSKLESVIMSTWDEATTETEGGLYFAKTDSAKSETAVQESAKPYSAKPHSANPESAKTYSGIC